MARIAVFCASSKPLNPFLTEIARDVGRGLAEDGHTILYGGSTKGLMGDLARTALKYGGKVEGYTPPELTSKEPPLEGINMMPCTSLPDRLASFRKADGFLVLPGGTGTAEEFFHVFNAMCFNEWNPDIPEAIPRRPIGLLADKSGILEHLYLFILKGTGAHLINDDIAHQVRYANWYGMKDWFLTRLPIAETA